MKLNRLLILGFLALITLSDCSGEENHQPKEEEGRTLDYTHQATFLSKQQEPVATIDVAVADEPQERNEGLMDVNSLPANKGMLFMFEEQEPLSFWMANTPLALDIIFINENHEIVRIHHSTQPFSEENFVSDKPAKYVIETNAGFSISHDIQEGSTVRWKEL